MTVRAGIVGAGMIGQDHARRLSRVLAGAQVTAVADADPAHTELLARSVPGAQPLRTGHDVIGSADVDAVVVTSSGPSHEEFVLAAIKAGKPVFCEKPLAPTPGACLRIVEAELAAGRRLVQVGFMRRYDDGYLAMKRAVDDGLIGTPLLAHCVHRNVASPPSYTSDMPFTDSAVHEMDIVRWLLSDEITALSVVAARRSSYAPAQLQDPQLLLMETAAGVHIDVEVFVNCQYGYDVRCELVGETGTVSLPRPAGPELRSGGVAGVPIAADWRARFARAYDTELQDWVDSVRRGQATGPSSWDGYAAAAVSQAALTAVGSGQRTPVLMKERPSCYA
jgi:myo-inositol 2-dehydrogenase / D-chiro-inositol 1-dehydrogenase